MSKFYQLSFKEQYRNSKLSTYNIIIFKIILTSIMEDIVSGYFNTTLIQSDKNYAEKRRSEIEN